jgi:universal stress protein E
MTISRILVIIDPTRQNQPALDRAIEAAQMTDASLILFASIFEKTTAPTKQQKSQFVQEQIAEQRIKLSALADKIRNKNIEVSTKVDWDDDWRQAAIRASIRHNCDVIFKSTIKHSSAQRVIKKTSDWALLRDSLCPVLLVREGASWSKNKVLAAVDFDSDDDAHQSLNKTILKLSQEVAKKYGSEVHFLNACSDSMAVISEEAANDFGVQVKQIRCEVGTPDKAIIDANREVEADIIIIGSIARNGVSGLFIGNTAEKILDHVDCDVLAML